MSNENVNNPPHYNTGEIEVFDYICDKLDVEELRGYIKGNVLKYVSREKHKGGLEDLRKAQWYINRYLDLIDGVNTVEPRIRWVQKPTDKSGTTAWELGKPKTKQEEQKDESTIEQRDLDLRGIQVLEKQNVLIERLLAHVDILSGLRERSTHASQGCQCLAGDSRSTGSTVQHA